MPIKFTPDGGDVVVGAKRIGSRLHFWVRDTGIGIAEEDFANLGKPFMQIQNDYTRRFEGTGLGLSLVKGLVALHEGTMSIESMPGEGTMVTISLPVERTEGAPGRTRPACCPMPDDEGRKGTEMARSAKQPKAVKRRSNAFEDGAMAVGGADLAQSGAGRRLDRIPGDAVLCFGERAVVSAVSRMPARSSPPATSRAFRTRAPTSPRPRSTSCGRAQRPRRCKSDPVVEQVQGILKDLDFYSGTVDGISGPNTRKAIQAYQQKVGLNASGEIDDAAAGSAGRNAEDRRGAANRSRGRIRRQPFRCP